MKKVFAVIFTLFAFSIMMPCIGLAKEEVTYINKIVENGTVKNEEKSAFATGITGTEKKLGNGEESWYVLDSDIVLTGRLDINGTVNLILMNNKTLTAPYGITLPEGNVLNVFAQSDDENEMGAINANGSGGNAALGGLRGEAGKRGQNSGNLTWNGGKMSLTAEAGTCLGGGDGGSRGGERLPQNEYKGNGGGKGGNGGIVIICGGKLILEGKNGIAGGTGSTGVGCLDDEYSQPGFNGGDGGSVFIYSGIIDVHASTGVCFGGGQGGVGGSRAHGNTGNSGGNGGRGGSIYFYSGESRFQSDSNSCINGGAGGIGGSGSHEENRGSTGWQGEDAVVTIEGKPTILAGETSQTAKTTSGYGKERYFSVDYNDVSKASFMLSSGNVWIIGICLFAFITAIVVLILVIKRLRGR